MKHSAYFYVLITAALLFNTSFALVPPQDYVEKIESTKLALSKAEKTEERIDLMCELANLYYTINPDSGVFYGNAALSLSYANDYLKGKINAHDRLGFLFQVLGKFDDASEHLTTALELTSLSPDSIQKVEILIHLGGMNVNQNLEQSLNYYLQALRLSKSMNDKQRVASGYNHIGSIYFLQNDFRKALEHNLLSLKTWNSIDSMRTTGISSDIGNIYYRLLDYNNALSYYQRANRIALKNSDYLGLGYTYANMGIVFMETGRMKESLEMLNESLKYRRILDNKEGISNSLALIARWHFRQQKYDVAYSYALQNAELARQIGLKRPIYDSYQILVDILTAQKQFAKALQYKTEWMAYKDSVTLKENASLRTRLEVTYETEKKESENKLLKEQQARTKVELERQALVIASIAVLLLFSAVGIFALYRSNVNKNRINSTLRKQKEIIHEQNVQLEQLNGVKDKLFSTITHDLRGPVSSLKLFISYLRDEELDHNVIKEYTRQSTATMDHIMESMENILQWSKSQWKGLTIEPTQINLHQIAKEKIRLLEQMAKKKSITVHNLVPPSTEAYADLQMINLVVRNLLSNAIKFTEQNGTIRVRCAEYDDIVEVSVEDSGIGMTEEQIKKIFTLEHSSLKGTQDEPGTGLGLLLCKEFVEKNGGKIIVESVLGAGSVFTFTVPRSQRILEQRVQPITIS